MLIQGARIVPQYFLSIPTPNSPERPAGQCNGRNHLMWDGLLQDSGSASSHMGWTHWFPPHVDAKRQNEDILFTFFRNLNHCHTMQQRIPSLTPLHLQCWNSSCISSILGCSWMHEPVRDCRVQEELQCCRWSPKKLSSGPFGRKRSFVLITIWSNFIIPSAPHNETNAMACVCIIIRPPFTTFAKVRL